MLRRRELVVVADGSGMMWPTRRFAVRDVGVPRGPGVRPRVPGMGRISLDERSQPEPMTVTVANRKA